MNPNVTILTPTYNHDAFISECIQSVLAQTYQAWEQIIVDDGSTDTTEMIVQRYVCTDPRIRYIRQAPKGIWGLAETYNTGLASAQGKLIAILEGDDSWPKEKLETQVEWHLANPELVLSYGLAETKGTQSRILSIPNQFIGIFTTHTLLAGILLRETFPTPVTTLINRHALERIGGFQSVPGFPAVDLPTFIRLLQNDGCVQSENVPLGYWRIHPHQTTQIHGVEMATLGLRIRLNALKRTPLSISDKQIIQAHQPVLTDTHLFRLRRALQERNRKASYTSAWYLVKHGTFNRKLQAGYGILAASIGIDMEAPLRRYQAIRRRLNRPSRRP